MTKGQLYLLLLVLGSSEAHCSLRTSNKRSRPGRKVAESTRFLQQFDTLSEEGTEIVVALRHSDPPQERDVFVTFINEAPPTSPSPTAASQTPSPTVVIGDESPAPSASTGGNETPAPTADDGPSTPSPTTIRVLITPAPTPLVSILQSDSLAPSEAPDDAAETPAPNDGSGTPAPSSTDMASLQGYLEGVVGDTTALTTSGTPQNSALRTLAESNPELDPTDPVDQVQIVQRYALNVLFFTTAGSTWANNQLWTTASPLCGDDAESSWHGVVCDAGGLQIVERLSLAGNDLNGQIPSEIALLSTLSKYGECVVWNRYFFFSFRRLTFSPQGMSTYSIML